MCCPEDWSGCKKKLKAQASICNGRVPQYSILELQAQLLFELDPRPATAECIHSVASAAQLISLDGGLDGGCAQFESVQVWHVPQRPGDIEPALGLA
jgi:hypothetical protein